MVGEVAPQSKTAIVLDDLAGALTGRKPPPPKKASITDKLSFLKR